MREILKYGLTLMVLAGLLSAVLSAVYQATEPRRIEIARRERQEALSEVLPEADHFQQKDWYFEGYESEEMDNPAGYAFIARGEGYGSAVETAVGARPPGGNGPLEISGIKIISHQETPGLGSRVEEVPPDRTLADIILRRPPSGRDKPSRPWFQEQFSGKTSEEIKINGIQAITGATITTEAVTGPVREGMERLEKELSR